MDYEEREFASFVSRWIEKRWGGKIKMFARFVRSLRTASRHVNRVANALAALFIFLMMFYVCADVLGRSVFSQPVPGAYEVVTMLMVFVVFLAFANTQTEKGHIRVGIVLGSLPRRARILTEVFTHLVFFVVFAFILWEGTDLAIKSWHEKEFLAGLINVPQYPARAVIPVGAFLLCLQLAFDILDLVGKLFRKDERDDGTH